MKRYISAARNYTTIPVLQKLLEDNGISTTKAWWGGEGDSILLDTTITFAIGQVNLVIKVYHGSCYYSISYGDTELLTGLLYKLFRTGTQERIAYLAACKAPTLEKLTQATSKEAVYKKYKAEKVKEMKELSTSELLEYVSHRDVPHEIAERALNYFRYRLTDDDWFRCYYNGGWVMSIINTEVENWASISMQAYGYHYTYTVQLDTQSNTYTTDIKDTKGWHTE